MSLRLRLVLLTVVLVAAVALSLSALYLDSLIRSLGNEAIDRSEFAGQQVNTFVTDHINQHSSAYVAPTTIEETKAIWAKVAAEDFHIPITLEKVMAASRSIIEINVAGEDGRVLVSSSPLRTNTPMVRLDSIASVNQGNLYQRVVNVFSRRPDYETTIPIGFSGQPVFTIQVVTSSVLLRDLLVPQIQRLLAITVGAILGSLLITVFTVAGAMRPIRRIEQTIDRIAAGSSLGDPQTEETPGGAVKEFRVMESKLNLLGQQIRGVRQDASQLRNNVDLLLERMASELNVASRLANISKLTGGVAHEIKNPLNAIVLRLDLLRERLGEPEEELRKEIDILSKEALRLDRVVKTFLDFARPVEVKMEQLDFSALVREVTDLILPQAKLAGIEVEFTAPPGPALMRGDQDMLKQAVLNLTQNAIEAMEPGGKLSVTLRSDDRHVTLEVGDTGPGIPPEVRSRVFQLYFTTKKRGTGIGLAMTYKAAQLHNGTIEFNSEVGRGTVFKMEFPTLVRTVR